MGPNLAPLHSETFWAQLGFLRVAFWSFTPKFLGCGSKFGVSPPFLCRGVVADIFFNTSAVGVPLFHENEPHSYTNGGPVMRGKSL